MCARLTRRRKTARLILYCFADQKDLFSVHILLDALILFVRLGIDGQAMRDYVTRVDSSHATSSVCAYTLYFATALNGLQTACERINRAKLCIACIVQSILSRQECDSDRCFLFAIGILHIYSYSFGGSCSHRYVRHTEKHPTSQIPTHLNDLRSGVVCANVSSDSINITRTKNQKQTIDLQQFIVHPSNTYFI